MVTRKYCCSRRNVAAPLGFEPRLPPSEGYNGFLHTRCFRIVVRTLSSSVLDAPCKVSTHGFLLARYWQLSFHRISGVFTYVSPHKPPIKSRDRRTAVVLAGYERTSYLVPISYSLKISPKKSNKEGISSAPFVL